MRAALTLWIWTVGGLISFTEASRYLTDYRHGEFGIGAELQQHNTGSPGGQYQGAYHQGRGYQQGGGYQVYDRRHHPHKTWPRPPPSSASASAAAVAASSSASAAGAASGSPAAASVAVAAGAAGTPDRRRGYHNQAQRKVYQYPAPRYIPREFEKQPAVQRSYLRPTIRSPYVHPSQAPAYVQPQQPPVYVQPTHAPVYPQWTPAPTQRPIYVQPTQRIYMPRTQAPIYVPRTQAPVYVQPTQAPVYVQRTQAPVYVQRTPAPVYVQPAPTSLVTSTRQSSSSDCSSSTLCFCCRWTTRYSQMTQTCNQPKQMGVQQQICMEIRNGACVRLGTISRLNQPGMFPAQCTSTRRERSCTSCCPSRYGQGMPRCTVTASISVQQQQRQQQQQQHGGSWYSAQSVDAARSAPTVVASAAASVAVPGHARGPQPSEITAQSYQDNRPRTVHQSVRRQPVAQTYNAQHQYPQTNQDRWSPAAQGRASIVICCLTTRRPECCKSSRRERLQSSGQAISQPQARLTDCCSTTRRPECCATSRQQALQSSLPAKSYYPVSSAVQPLWQSQQRQQQQQQQPDCCSTTGRPECCQSARGYRQQQQYQRSQLVASTSTGWSQSDCCSTSRKPECCASSRAALGVPVSRSRTSCCGSSQPRVSCCASLRLADCCGSSRIALCCRITNDVGKCCSGASYWGK